MKSKLREAIDETLKIEIPQEIIIMIITPSDGTKKILEEYKNNNNIKIIYQTKNLGFGNSIQDGFNYSSNDFIYINMAILNTILIKVLKC